jgi:hypothetical protein
MSRRLGLTALAVALVVAATTPGPASAVTGSWADGVLNIGAVPGDGDVTVSVIEGDTEYTADQLYVTTSPDVELSGCTRGLYPTPTSWFCKGQPQLVVVEGGEGHADITSSTYAVPNVEITAGAEGGSIVADGQSGQITGRSAPDSVSASFYGLTARLGAGDDRLVWRQASVFGSANLGVGDDVFLVTARQYIETQAATVAVQGGAGDDEVSAAGRALRVYGGPGDDRFEPDATSPDVENTAGVSSVVSRDVVDGGPGSDTVVLANPDRSRPVRITLDGRPDDGQPGERDNYGDDVENVVVHFVAAVVVGNPLDNRIELLAGGTSRGGRGADILVGGDVLVGGGGHDAMFAGRATSVVRANDGARDDIRCTNRRTVVHADRHDVVAAGCRRVIRH